MRLRGLPDPTWAPSSAAHGEMLSLDSVVRAREVFGQARVVVISQRFHCERAVFLARQRGLDAWGFAAHDVDGYHGAKVRAREALARVRAVLDVVVGTEPRYLGPREQVILGER